MVIKTNKWQPHEEALTEDIQIQSCFRNRTPEIVNDRFRIVGELGRGGMATVYLAEDLTEGKQVAIKMMSSALSGSAKQRFTREFSTIASLKHPYLVEVFEYGESQLGPFFVMELFSGEPATKMIGAAAPHVYDALYKLCEAVEFVHSKRIIHRDIKPANIMVQAKAGGNGFDIRLSDFGLAKFANSSSSITGDVNFLGTLAYCAPDQIMREELDYRADLYSLGMVVYEVLTGHHPFEACRNDAQALISAQLTRHPAHIREFNKQLSVDLERVVHQMLAKEPEERPQSTLELRHALANELGWSDGKVSNAFAGAPRNMAAPFVGRESELKSLEGFITRCCRGYSDSDSMLPAKKEPATILFVAGEAGIGKTSLIKRAARSALIGGAKIYDGRCFDGNLAPFQPFAEILKQILSERERVRRKARKGPQGDSLASTTFVQVAGSTLATQAIDSVIEEHAVDLLRCSAELKSLLEGDLKADRTEIPRDSEYVFRSIAGFFVELSKHQSMLLLIDDIHWADRSSVILLRHIASSATIARHDAEIRGGPSPRLAIVGSTRNTNEYGKTLRFINELCESDLADKLTLTPLSEEGVRQLVSNQIGARYDEVAESLSSRIAMECLGNPFYICQTIREWKLNGRIKFDGLLWGLSSEQFADGETLPDSVREALQARLRKLPDVTAKTLGIAAVMGANVDVDLLQLLAGQGNEFGFFDTLDDLLGREILRETGRPKILAFAHDLLREACLSNLSATRRQGIHQIIGEALERQRESGKNVTDSLLAEHFLAAHCDKKAFEYLVRAGCSATATYAHADAVSLLEKAKQLDSPSYAKSVRYRLYEHLGASYAAIGRFENSIDEFESAFEVAQSQFELAKIHFGIGKAHTWIGRNDKGRESYESALKLIGHPQPKSKLGYAWGAILSGIQFQFAPRWRVSFWQKKTDTSSETLASEIYFANCFLLFQIHILAYVYGSIQLALLAKHSNDSDAIALAYSKYGMNMAVAGAIGQYLGRRYLREAESRLEQCKSPFVRSLAIQSLATASYYEGDLDSAEKKLVAIQLELDKSRDWHAGVNFHWRRHVASQRGVATEIQALALAEMEFGDRSCEPILKAWGRYGLADALSRQGDFDRAIECAAESVALLEKTVLKSVAYQELGRALIQASRYEEAEKTLQTGLRQMRSDLFCLDVTVQTLSLYPEAILGSDWFLVPSRISKDRRKRGYRAAKNARWWAMLFPNMRAHTYRVSGRASAASGKTREALRHFDRALREATRFGNQSEYARTLVDKSMLLRGEESERLRREGLSRLKDLHTVLPVAEAVHLEVQ